MSEPIDLAALTDEQLLIAYGNAYFDCGEWAEGNNPKYAVVCKRADAIKAEVFRRLSDLRGAIEQKDAALLEIKGHCRYAIDMGGMRAGVPRFMPSTAKWLESIVDPALALSKKGGA